MINELQVQVGKYLVGMYFIEFFFLSFLNFDSELLFTCIEVVYRSPSCRSRLVIVEVHTKRNCLPGEGFTVLNS